MGIMVPKRVLFCFFCFQCNMAFWPLIHHRHTPPQSFYGRFWDHPGEPVPEEKLLDLMVQGKINRGWHTNHPAGATPSGVSSAHLYHPPYFLRTGCSCCRPTNSDHLSCTDFNNFLSKRELTFMFTICYRPSVCHPSVCNARAPYSGSSNFRQYFYGIWYLGHPLTSTENFTEIIPGEPVRRGS